MSTHTYTIASFSSLLDVEWIRHLIVIESPSLVTGESEIEVHMDPVSSPGNVECIFVPTLSGAQVTQLDAIMSGYTGRPALAPAGGYWQDEDATFYSTSSVYPTYHPCMENTVTLDPGTYRIKFEVVDSVSVTGNGMRSRFQINGSTVGNQDYHDDQDDNHKSSYVRETEVVVTTRGDYYLVIAFCKDFAGSYQAEIRDLKMVVDRV